MKRFVQTLAIERLKKLDSELRVASGKPEDPEAIHDVRVAIRRLLQCFLAFPGWFDPRRVKQIRRRLKKLLDGCGKVRDCDIAIEVLRAAGSRDQRLTDGFQERRRRAQKKLARRLLGWRKRETIQRWREHARVTPAGGTWRGEASAEENARRVLPKMAKDLFAAGREAAAPAASRRAMHRFRLAAKRFRYTLELFEPAYGRSIKSVLASLRKLQDKLGAINDCATTLEMLGSHDRAAAMIRRLARSREAEFRKYWKSDFGIRARARWARALG
jgi:CHAD domain-containing protein